MNASSKSNCLSNPLRLFILGKAAHPIISPRNTSAVKAAVLILIESFSKRERRFASLIAEVQKNTSLPLLNNKEFIYPILIDLLNYIQDKSDKKVVITSGHRCPEHNAYIDSSKENQASKHMIGAEVSFYVKGLEDQPEKVIKLIQSYYQEKPKICRFKRISRNLNAMRKIITNVSSFPWMNKEIFVKLFKKKGRPQF